MYTLFEGAGIPQPAVSETYYGGRMTLDEMENALR